MRLRKISKLLKVSQLVSGKIGDRKRERLNLRCMPAVSVVFPKTTRIFDFCLKVTLQQMKIILSFTMKKMCLFLVMELNSEISLSFTFFN